MTPDNTLPTPADPDNDPHLWLEDIEGAGPLGWVEAQNARTLARFGNAQFALDRDTLAALFDRPDKIPHVTRRGGLLYNFWQDAVHPRGLWRRTGFEDYRRGEPAWDVLLDLDALAAAEGEDWVFAGSQTLPPSHERAILRLSRGGSDACVLREFDLARKCFVEDGFNLPEAKSWASWLDRDAVLLCTALGGGDAATRSGYARRVRLWRRGTEPLSGPVLFEVDEKCMSASAYLDRTAKEERVFFISSIGFFERDYWIGDRTGPKTRLALPADAIWPVFWGGWFAVKLRSPWTVRGKTYAR
jgi:prolyl oligopeptidase